VCCSRRYYDHPATRANNRLFTTTHITLTIMKYTMITINMSLDRFQPEISSKDMLSHIDYVLVSLQNALHVQGDGESGAKQLLGVPRSFELA
jgi:hypothetical protein